MFSFLKSFQPQNVVIFFLFSMKQSYVLTTKITFNGNN